MVDNLTKEQRSYTMSKIRSKGTKQEKIVHVFLKEAGVSHTMHPNMVDKPDIIIKKEKIAIFLDGCFWHGCKKHYIEPKTNINYWRKKIKYNIERDKRNTALLKESGWRVIRIWEHEIKDGTFEKKLKVI